MHKAGVVVSWAGVLSTLIGLIAGFMQLLREGESSWLGLAPMGFALLLLGVALTQLSRGR
jgi:hypothetical protein